MKPPQGEVIVPLHQAERHLASSSEGSEATDKHEASSHQKP